MSETIMLGAGVFSIGNTAIALTRGGGKFTVERTYKPIVADGDMGPVKGRIRKDGSTAKLLMKALEMLPSNLPKMYPATELDVSVPGTETFKAKEDIEDADYSTVKFTGETTTGESLVITLENAINLGNIDWAVVDKDEIVAEVEYTATYLSTARKTEPWKVDYVTV